MPDTKSKKPFVEPRAMESVIGYRIARAKVATQALFQRHIGKPYSLRPVEFTLLLMLQANKGLAPKQLCKALSLPAPHLTILLDRLQERGLIERVRSSVDRRSQQVLLTEPGTELAAELARHAPHMEDDLRGCLTTGERAMLIELLDKVASYADKLPEAEEG